MTQTSHDADVRRAIVDWYGEHARDLPWRRADTTPWAVLVSEIMLQQTPVARVLRAYEKWLTRWPRPVDLATAEPGEAVRQWDRLGYPRRALRLHAAARVIVDRHGGQVPQPYEDLLALPGIGTYTAAAVASFAFGQRHAVVDTNVRRVLARVFTGVQFGPPSPTAAERRLAERLLPPEREPKTVAAPRWAIAVMELGALVCTARLPRCGTCPVAGHCAWLQAGHPPYDGPARRAQRFEGTDRQARGRLMAVLRGARQPVGQARLDAVWPEPLQRARALDGLVADGLVKPLPGNLYRLPA